MKLPSSPTRISLLSKSVLAVGCMLVAGHAASAAVLLEYWDFNNDSSVYSSPTLGKFATANPGGGTSVNNGEIYNATTKLLSSNAGGFTGGPVFTNGSIDFSGVSGNANSGNTSSAGFGAFADAAGNGHPATNDPSTKQGSLGLFVNSASPVNQTLVFNLTSTGYNTLAITFDGRRASGVTGPAIPVAWSYSLDGGLTFTSFTTPALNGVAATFAANTFNLPTALDNLSGFELKAVFSFTTANVGSSYAIDNLQLTGLAAVPEPKTYALVIAGVMVILLRRKNRRLA